MKTYCNPVNFSDQKKHTNPDPFILRWCGKYYCYSSDEKGAKVSSSKDMVNWEFHGYALSEKDYHEYWAPSVIYLNGKFYMYYSSRPLGETDCHEEHLKVAVSDHPLGPFEYRKTFFEKFSIDSHPILWNGELYMFYSVNDWIGLENEQAGTCILLDKMKTPEEFSHQPIPVILPSLKQEIFAKNRFGDGRDWYTIEGAAHVIHGNRFWLLYSANAYVDVNYFVGTTVAENKENLLDMKWEKYPNPHTWMPLLKKNDVVEGTGHNTITKAPNLFEDWIVYHGREVEEGICPGTEQRDMRIDPLMFFDNRLFCHGPSYYDMPFPGVAEVEKNDCMIDEKVFFTEAPFYYRMELWCTLQLSHAGGKYRIYLEYADDRNYVALEIHSGRRSARILHCEKGIEKQILCEYFASDYRFDVPCFIQVERRKYTYQVIFDEIYHLNFEIASAWDTANIGIEPQFSSVHLSSLRLAEGAELRGQALQHITDFYESSAAIIEKDRLIGKQMNLNLQCNNGEHIKGLYGKCKERFTECFVVSALSEECRITFTDEKSMLSCNFSKGNILTVYHSVCGKDEYFVTDGNMIWKDTEVQEKTISGIQFCKKTKGKMENFNIHICEGALLEYTVF